MISPWLEERFDIIVVPYDFSAAADDVVDIALGLVSHPDNVRVVHVLHVMPDMNPSLPGYVWSAADEPERKRRVEGEIRNKLVGAGKEVEIAVRTGDPGHEIVDYAEEVSAGVILIPSHGRTGIARVLLGSVTERVVRHAHCPVMVIKPTDKSWREKALAGRQAAGH